MHIESLEYSQKWMPTSMAEEKAKLCPWFFELYQKSIRRLKKFAEEKHCKLLACTTGYKACTKKEQLQASKKCDSLP